MDEASLLELMSQTQKLKNLCLRDTHLTDIALYNFSGSSLEMLDVSNTKISSTAVAHIARRNPGLKCLEARGCRNLHQQEKTEGARFSSSCMCSELITELGRTCILEEIAIGWGFAYSSLEVLSSAVTSLRAIAVGLGGSLGEGALKLLPTLCPLLESLILQFQVISDCIIANIMKSQKHLQVVALCYCFGDISMSSFRFSVPNLRKLRLERVTPWMTNNDLFTLTQNCVNIIEISLVGCMLLDAGAQQIISFGWPGLISLRLEDCGEVTANGVCSLSNCIALEELLLRHNGPGICKNFILDAASKMPMLRQISLDLCDASEGDFDIPDLYNRCFLSTVKIARCKSQKCALSLQQVQEARGRPVHKETLVLAWSSRHLARTVVKERL